jgi:hypothetical protein
MKPTNSTISLDDAVAEAGLSLTSFNAPINVNPPSATDLGSGNSTRMPLPAAPSNIGVGVSTDPQWDSNRTNGDWSGK